MKFELKTNNVGNRAVKTVLARDIWIELESKQEFANWIKNRIKQGGFVEGVDFIVLDKAINAETLGLKSKVEYYISIDMAKHLGMMERNEKGKEVRQHFIDLKNIKIPALSLEEMTLQVIQGQQAKIIELEVQKKIDAPKVEFAMAVRQMHGACLLGDFAKTIGAGRNRLFSKLREDSILMAGNLPLQRYLEQGLFKVVEKIPFTDSDGKTHPAFATYLTGKGQVWIEKRYRDYKW